MKENISMIDILKMCLKKWYIIAIFAAVFALGAYLYSSFIATPMYKSEGQLNVTNTSNVELATEVTTGGLSAGERLGTTFIEMMKNDAFLSKVKNMGNFDLSENAIRRMLVFEQPDETTLINVRVNSSDAELAYMLAQEILHHAPAYLEGEVSGSNVKVIQKAKLERAPYSPNVRNNVLIGAAIGIVLGILLALCLEFFNKKIRGGEELEEAYGYPVLGEIPNLRSGKSGGIY